MARFTENNTEGFSAADLSTLNSALDILIEDGIDDDMNRVSDALNNAWFEDASADELVAIVKNRFAA